MKLSAEVLLCGFRSDISCVSNQMKPYDYTHERRVKKLFIDKCV